MVEVLMMGDSVKELDLNGINGSLGLTVVSSDY